MARCKKEFCVSCFSVTILLLLFIVFLMIFWCVMDNCAVISQLGFVITGLVGAWPRDAFDYCFRRDVIAV